MTSYRRFTPYRPSRICGALALVAATAMLALPLKAVEVSQVTLEVEDSLGIPAIQAVISACLGELVFLTGSVHIVVVDGVAQFFNWQGMTGRTLDGDKFIGGSGVNLGTQSNITLAEVGAGENSRLVHLQIVGGVLTVTCH